MAQAHYMPLVAQELAENDEDDAEQDDLAVESISLSLPSSVPANQTSVALRTLEHRLRFGQAEDALTQIRHYLRSIAGLQKFHTRNIAGAGVSANTRAQAVFK